MKALNTLVFASLLVAVSGSAYAKKDQREGLNFGLNLRLLNDQDKSLAGDETTKNSNKESDVQAVNPYVGYVVFDSLNLGISGLFEKSSVNETIVSSQDDSKIERTSQSAMKAVSLFTRFMFAKFMYFEAGLGIYDRKVDVKNEYTTDEGDGIFSGKREEYSVRGLGPGYHLGAGIELGIVNGFYFTSSYTYRNITLRDRTSDSLGKKRAKIEQRELSFGIAHYVD